MADMLVNLYSADYSYKEDNFSVIRALICDRDKVLNFVKENYPNWEMECYKSLLENKCFIAIQNKKIIGFSCFDGVGLGYFGPIGVENNCKGKGVGKALLKETLLQMKNYGYGYAIIGWVNDEAEKFYNHSVNAKIIENSSNTETIYKRLI